MTRLSISFVLACGLASPQRMQVLPGPVPVLSSGIALIAHTGAQSPNANSVTTSAINTTGANFIIVAAVEYSAGRPVAPTDSLSNTWTPLGVFNAGNVATQMYYCVGCTVGSGQTFSVSASGFYPSLFVLAFSGVKNSSPQDGSTAGANNAGTGIAVQPGSLTAGASGEVFVTALAAFLFTAAPTLPGDPSFTIKDAFAWNGTALGGGLAYKIDSGLGSPSNNPTWTEDIESTTELAVTMAVFKHQ